MAQAQDASNDFDFGGEGDVSQPVVNPSLQQQDDEDEGFDLEESVEKKDKLSVMVSDATVINGLTWADLRPRIMAKNKND